MNWKSIMMFLLQTGILKSIKTHNIINQFLDTKTNQAERIAQGVVVPSNWMINSYRNLFQFIFSILSLVVKVQSWPHEPGDFCKPTQSGHLWNKIRTIIFNPFPHLRLKTTLTRLLKIWPIYQREIPRQHDQKAPEAKQFLLMESASPKETLSLSLPLSFLIFLPPILPFCSWWVIFLTIWINAKIYL